MASIHFSRSLVIAEDLTPGVDPNAPILAYKNIVTFDSITATSELLDRPITNAANPATAYTWEASSNADQTITVDTGGQTINYIGIARHNLNQLGLTLRIDLNGVTVVPAQAVSDNQAILFLLNTATPDEVELVIEGATDPAKIAVLYIGQTTLLQRNIYVGHTPMEYGRDRQTVNGLSENGQYLGELVVRESKTTQVNLQNLTPDWYRSTLDPYFALKPRVPCFWSWRPGGYPSEVNYAWVEGEPQMSNQRVNGMVQASWTFRGIA